MSAFHSVHEYLLCFGARVEPETVLRDYDGLCLRDNVLNLPVRSDFTYFANGVALQETVVSPKPAPASSVQVGFCDHTSSSVKIGMCDHNKLTLHQVAWEELVLTVDGQFDLNDLRHLRAWYLEWSLPRRMSGKTPCKGAVHSMQGPLQSNGRSRLRLDMGTAPVEAAEELLDLLIGQKLGDVAVGTAPRVAYVEAD